MITTAQLTNVLAGRGVVLGESGTAIGRLDQIFVDDRSGMPEWVTARLSAATCFIPLAEATVDGRNIHAPYSLAQIEQAPRPAALEGYLSEQQESELFHYYGLQWLDGASERVPGGGLRVVHEPAVPAELVGVGGRA